MARRKPRLEPVDRKRIVFRFEGTIKALEGVAGQARLSPRLLVSLWIYAYSRGASSAREISRLAERREERLQAHLRVARARERAS
ncbi:MAG: hypothetical protein AAB225_28665 [Acidobacteriota bacterium]